MLSWSTRSGPRGALRSVDAGHLDGLLLDDGSQGHHEVALLRLFGRVCSETVRQPLPVLVIHRGGRMRQKCRPSLLETSRITNL